MKRIGFVKQLEKLNHKAVEDFENFLDSYLPYDPVDPKYSDTLYNRFYELPEEMQWASFLVFLKDREKIKGYEFDFSLITDAFKGA